MNYSPKFSPIETNPANVVVPMQPLVVRQHQDAESQSSVSHSRRSDDRLPIMIHAGDVVVIDGNHGHDHIDLRGYSVDDALFHGNTIEINKGTDEHFVIQYKNVREAVFAGDVTVDL